jgi:hypothetical protein
MRTRTHQLSCLARLLAIPEADLGDPTFYGRQRLLAKLERRLRADRGRDLARHWTYELGRHTAIYFAYRCERDAFHRDFGVDPPLPAAWKPCGPIASGPAVRTPLVLPQNEDTPGRRSRG